MRAKILVVDDDSDIVLSLQNRISAMGHEPVPATDGKEALRLIQEEEPDLVLTDLEMPGLHGLELIKQARQLIPDLCIVVLTAYGTVERAVQCIQSGAADFIPKPFTSDHLNAVINKLLKEVDLRREIHLLRRELQPSSPSYGTRAEVDTPNDQGNRATAIRSPSSQATRESSSLQDRSDLPIYPYIMGGLLHNALNAILLITDFQENLSRKAANSEVDGALKGSLELVIPATKHLTVLLRAMQHITHSFYDKEEKQSVHSQVHETISLVAQGNPTIKYHPPTVSSALDHVSIPAGACTFIAGELLKNATKACSDREGAEIWLTIDVMEHKNLLSFECQDSGAGFSEDMLTKIRAQALRPPRGNQVGGYGLYLIQTLTLRLGGNLLVSNKESGGARIQVLIPLTV